MTFKINRTDLDNRRRIYNTILKYPGLHLRELSRKTNMSLGGLRHHLRFLIKQGLIVKNENPRYTRYYVSQKVNPKDKEIFNLLRQDMPRRIILLLFCKGPGDIYRSKKAMQKAKKNPETYLRAYSKKELTELTKHWKGPYAKLFYLDKHPTTLDFHLQKLLAADLIEEIKVGKELKYKLKDTDKIFSFLIINNFELSDETVNIFLEWTRIFSQEKIESMEKRFYDILPHPYHV